MSQTIDQEIVYASEGLSDDETYTLSVHVRRPHRVIINPPKWAFWRGSVVKEDHGWERIVWTLSGRAMKCMAEEGGFHAVIQSMRVEYMWGLQLEETPNGRPLTGAYQVEEKANDHP